MAKSFSIPGGDSSIRRGEQLSSIDLKEIERKVRGSEAARSGGVAGSETPISRLYQDCVGEPCVFNFDSAIMESRLNLKSTLDWASFLIGLGPREDFSDAQLFAYVGGVLKILDEFAREILKERGEVVDWQRLTRWRKELEAGKDLMTGPEIHPDRARYLHFHLRGVQDGKSFDEKSDFEIFGHSCIVIYLLWIRLKHKYEWENVTEGGISRRSTLRVQQFSRKKGRNDLETYLPGAFSSLQDIFFTKSVMSNPERFRKPKN